MIYRDNGNIVTRKEINNTIINNEIGTVYCHLVTGSCIITSFTKLTP